MQKATTTTSGIKLHERRFKQTAHSTFDAIYVNSALAFEVENNFQNMQSHCAIRTPHTWQSFLCYFALLLLSPPMMLVADAAAAPSTSCDFHFVFSYYRTNRSICRLCLLFENYVCCILVFAINNEKDTPRLFFFGVPKWERTTEARMLQKNKRENKHNKNKTGNYPLSRVTKCPTKRIEQPLNRTRARPLLF